MTVDQIIAGDAAELMGQIPDGSIPLTVTSPPYGTLRTYNGFAFDFRAIATELYRVTRDGGVVVWVVGDETVDGGESGESFRQVLYFMSLGFSLHDTMIYMKAGPSYPSRDKYYQVFEYMFVLSRGKPNVFHPIKDRKNRWWGQKWSKTRTRRNRQGELKRTDWYKDEGEQFGVRFNIWQYVVGYQVDDDPYCHQHPAIFPEELASDHILSWSNPGDIVLDPMCGSGTTLKMAKETGRHYIGFDISPEYVELSNQRVAGARIPLFTT